eukprot:3750352-Pleurochrysis_carterae.AAC.1
MHSSPSCRLPPTSFLTPSLALPQTLACPKDGSVLSSFVTGQEPNTKGQGQDVRNVRMCASYIDGFAHWPHPSLGASITFPGRCGRRQQRQRVWAGACASSGHEADGQLSLEHTHPEGALRDAQQRGDGDRRHGDPAVDHLREARARAPAAVARAHVAMCEFASRRVHRHECECQVCIGVGECAQLCVGARMYAGSCARECECDARARACVGS